MKLRIIEVFGGGPPYPWFRLERLNDMGNWEFLSSGQSIEKLKDEIPGLVNPPAPKVIEEIEV